MMQAIKNGWQNDVLNFWESFIFWGAKSGPLTHASADKTPMYGEVALIKEYLKG